MGKFKRRLVKEIKEEKKKAQEQQRLHEKYQVPDEDVMIVEKQNMCKFLVRIAGEGIRGVAVVMLLVLATAGAMAFLYPQIRSELLRILSEILLDMRQLLS